VIVPSDRAIVPDVIIGELATPIPLAPEIPTEVTVPELLPPDAFRVFPAHERFVPAVILVEGVL
jgi:hypothetical protein